MATPRVTLRLSALCAVVLLGGLIPAPAALAQNDDSRVGTRSHDTRKVDWDSLRRDEARRGRMDPQTGALLEAPAMVATVPRDELAKTRLPVLLPDDEHMLEKMRLFARADHYVASLRDDTHSVQITGTRIDQGKLRMKSARRRMKASSDDEGFVYQRTEYGCELSFTRYNVSYNISVECRKPDTDPRCTGKDYIKGLAQSLVYVGGGPEDGDSQ